LGAYDAQINLGLAAIGGKDSMSGTYQDLNVPPTLISLLVQTEKKKISFLLNLKMQEIKYISSIISLRKTDFQTMML
jgi:phosphoribosylformylglycinamidine (FGAM) synthase-like enzyme